MIRPFVVYTSQYPFSSARRYSQVHFTSDSYIRPTLQSILNSSQLIQKDSLYKHIITFFLKKKHYIATEKE